MSDSSIYFQKTHGTTAADKINQAFYLSITPVFNEGKQVGVFGGIYLKKHMHHKNDTIILFPFSSDTTNHEQLQAELDRWIRELSVPLFYVSQLGIQKTDFRLLKRPALRLKEGEKFPALVHEHTRE